MKFSPTKSSKFSFKFFLWRRKVFRWQLVKLMEAIRRWTYAKKFKSSYQTSSKCSFKRVVFQKVCRVFQGFSIFSSIYHSRRNLLSKRYQNKQNISHICDAVWMFKMKNWFLVVAAKDPIQVEWNWSHLSFFASYSHSFFCVREHFSTVWQPLELFKLGQNKKNSKKRFSNVF